MKKIVIKYGIMAPSIKEQLKNQGVKIETDRFDNIHDSIKVLYVHEYITESQMKKCLDKLGRSINDHIRMLKNEDYEDE